ncbi:hypothetical protein [Haemophilus haemolyticus]|uniref:hypothetical protein n=1 Tax=Haemophilus haemolyticus TaxID=726 RepID=UPI000E57A72E|nr:hypothetical protein [Haemophilus haemolyticus]
MTNLSLNPIFESFAPIFKQLKVAAMSALFIAPLAMNHPVRHSTHTVNIFSVKAYENKSLNQQDIEKIIDMVKAVSAITDFVIASITTESLSYIDLNDVLRLENKINKYDGLVHNIIANNKSPELSTTLQSFSNKMHTLCNMMKSEKYKQQSDEVVLSRIYHKSEDAGYTYKSSHSFDDFKKAVMM